MNYRIRIYRWGATLLWSLCTLIVTGQGHQHRLETIDALHYQFHLSLYDTTDVIDGRAMIFLQLKKANKKIVIDLASTKEDWSKGMRIQSLQVGGKPVNYVHESDKITIELQGDRQVGDTLALQLHYRGIPQRGLVISKSKFGSRTFFGDNWPDGAHHWLPCVDHPSDKASVEFIVECPENYQVIATGIQVEESNLANARKLSHWKTDISLPTKVMVIGVAEFAVHYGEELYDIPLSTWVFPENRSEGFYDFEISRPILQFFIDHIAEYPFEKLASVQSKTQWGGMENAGNIFYSENSVNGYQQNEDLIAHEIAHQWFGDSASEENWHHVWLSEGFATYLADLYVEWSHGKEVFRRKLADEREQVFQFERINKLAIVDTTITNLRHVLNTNTYKKAAWFLHMLRIKIGDEAFWESLQTYYKRYKYANALSEDFQEVVEEISKSNLSTFFQQWLYQPGHPISEIEWSQDDSGILTLSISQKNNDSEFEYPLKLKMVMDSGEFLVKVFPIRSKMEKIEISLKSMVTDIIVDPDIELLAETSIRQR